MGVRGGRLMKPSFARRLPTLFHRLHFDWTTGRCPFQEPASGLRFGGRVGLLVKPSQSASQLYFTDYTLTGQPLSPRKSQSCDWGAWGELLVKSSRGASRLYFTDYTLTGQPILRLPNGTMVGLVADKSPS